MKKIVKECPILIGIGALAIILTLVAYVFKDTAYAQNGKEADPSKAPMLTVVLNGVRDGVFPWTLSEADDEVLLADNVDDGQDVTDKTDSSAVSDVAKVSAGETDKTKAPAENADAEKDDAASDVKETDNTEPSDEADGKDKTSEETLAVAGDSEEGKVIGTTGQDQTAGDTAVEAQQAQAGGAQGEAQQAQAGGAQGEAQQAADGTQAEAQGAAQEVSQETAQEIPAVASEPRPVPVVEDRVYNFTTVTDDYFSDALFIGDSRTVGLSEYCAPLDQRAVFYSKISMSIYDVMKKKFISSPNGKIGLEQALSENSFGKIYIMLGLNEIGTGSDEYFRNAYKGVVDRIRELQPGAIIYIQGIMHVTANKSNSNQYFNNQRINSRNAAISTLADQKYIFYIDMNPAVDDENGDLMQDLSFDDVHLKASSYQRWYDFLLQHAIVR